MKANWPVTKRVEACVRNASTKHALTVWLDRMTIFGRKMAVVRPYMAVLSSQTIHACFAVAFWAQASTSFATGQLEVHFRLFVGTLNVNETLHWCNFRLPLEQIKLIISSCEAFSHIIILNLLK